MIYSSGIIVDYFDDKFAYFWFRTQQNHKYIWDRMGFATGKA